MHVFSKYNSLLEMLKTRNALKQTIMEGLIAESTDPNAKPEITEGEVIRKIGYPKLAQTIHLNESTLFYTDELLEDFIKILSDLPKIAESHISREVLDSYSTILKFELSEKNKQWFLKRTPVNETQYEKIVGEKPMFG